MVKLNPNILYICVHGELFGGIYPNYKVKHDVTPIQKGVYYSDKHKFMAFDLRVREKDKHYIKNYLVACKLFEQANIPYLKPLMVGPIDQCMKYDISFDSTIPALLNKPPISGKNLCEGIVVKQLTRKMCGDKDKGRYIRKIKNEKFAEVNKDTTDLVITLTKEERERS